MEQLIFFALIIIFSIIESAARSRKRKAGGPLPEVPPEWERDQTGQRRRPPTAEMPSYDADPSFDDRPSFDDVATSETATRERTRSSESMIPADIWEELAGLAKESQRPAETPKPAPPPKRAPPPPPRPAPPVRPAPSMKPMPAPAPKPRAPITAQKRATILAPEPAPEGTAGHMVHLSHAAYGTDPSTRARSAQDGLDPLAGRLSPDAQAVRRQLRGQGVHALRQAIILQEVLGPPVGSRPDPS